MLFQLIKVQNCVVLSKLNFAVLFSYQLRIFLPYDLHTNSYMILLIFVVIISLCLLCAWYFSGNSEIKNYLGGGIGVAVGTFIKNIGKTANTQVVTDTNNIVDDATDTNSTVDESNKTGSGPTEIVNNSLTNWLSKKTLSTIEMQELINLHDQNTISLDGNVTKIVNNAMKPTLRSHLFSKIITNSLLHLQLLQNKPNDLSLSALKRNATLLTLARKMMLKKYPAEKLQYSEENLQSLTEGMLTNQQFYPNFQSFTGYTPENILIKTVLSTQSSACNDSNNNISSNNSNNNSNNNNTYNELIELREKLRECHKEKIDLEVEIRKLKDGKIGSTMSTACEILLRTCKDEKEDLQRKIISVQRDLDIAKNSFTNINSLDVENYKRQIVDLQSQNRNLVNRINEIQENHENIINSAKTHAHELQHCQRNLSECELNVATIFDQIDKREKPSSKYTKKESSVDTF